MEKRTNVSDWSLPPVCFQHEKDYWLESYYYIDGRRIVWLCEDDEIIMG